MAIFSTRLLPGSDLKQEVESLVLRHQIKAGWVITCVGSLTNYCLRFANQKTGAAGKGHFEILSLAGTLSMNGSHLHICLGDENGSTLGGHLLEGCLVYTTAELIIESNEQFTFERRLDDKTGFKELNVLAHKIADDENS